MWWQQMRARSDPTGGGVRVAAESVATHATVAHAAWRRRRSQRVARHLAHLGSRATRAENGCSQGTYICFSIRVHLYFLVS